MRSGFAAACSTVAYVEPVTTGANNEFSCCVVKDKSARHIALAPPEGDGDHAIEPSQDEPFQPCRLSIIDDEGAQHSCQTQSRNHESRQHQRQVSAAQDK